MGAGGAGTGAEGSNVAPGRPGADEFLWDMGLLSSTW